MTKAVPSIRPNAHALLCAAAALLSIGPAMAQETVPPPRLASGGAVAVDDRYIGFLTSPAPADRSYADPAAAHGSAEGSTRERVRFASREPVGTIVIRTAERHLYLVEANGTALRYLVGVGREGFGWRGTERVSAKRRWPDWRPPADMLARRPDLPRHMPGGPDNPLGAGALYLGDTLYRIHGSNEPESVGESASSGCFRMRNSDLTDLYDRVRIGARVVVL